MRARRAPEMPLYQQRESGLRCKAERQELDPGMEDVL